MGRFKISDKQLKDNKKEYMRQYRLKNKDKDIERSKNWRSNNPDYSKQWHQDNKEGVKEYHQQWHHDNREKANQASRRWVQENKNKLNESAKQRKQTDPLYKLSCNIRILILVSFNKKHHNKTSKTTDILGCSFEQFKQHIESQFKPWMTWNNRGGRSISGLNTTWDLDHIIPISSATTEDDIKRLNHYTNFQPLCSYQNRFIKKNKI
jgi:hypothetical protein